MKYLSNVVSLRYDPRTCTGCGRCLEVCPRGVFVRQNGKVAIVDRDLCMECGACMGNCPEGALVVQAGVGCAAAVLNNMLTSGGQSCDCSSSGGDAGCCAP